VLIFRKIYKDIDEVIRVVDEIEVSKKIVKLKSLCVAKG